jgi:hypothetical protein
MMTNLSSKSLRGVREDNQEKALVLVGDFLCLNEVLLHMVCMVHMVHMKIWTCQYSAYENLRNGFTYDFAYSVYDFYIILHILPIVLHILYTVMRYVHMINIILHII